MTKKMLKNILGRVSMFPQDFRWHFVIWNANIAEFAYYTFQGLKTTSVLHWMVNLVLKSKGVFVMFRKLQKSLARGGKKTNHIQSTNLRCPDCHGSVISSYQTWSEPTRPSYIPALTTGASVTINRAMLRSYVSSFIQIL